MESRLIFPLAVIGASAAWAVLAGTIAWPHLRAMPRAEALRWLALPHAFRFIGLSFLIPGVVSPLLPAAFAVPDAAGDVVASILALIAITALTKRWSSATLLVWLLSLWGTLDLLNGYYLGLSHNVNIGALGAAYYLPTLVVPGLLVAHVLAFILLLRPHAAHVPQLEELA